MKFKKIICTVFFAISLSNMGMAADNGAVLTKEESQVQTFMGIDPGLDFSNMPELIEVYERVTRMNVPPRQPYAGQLVFAAFSGSHQDAIAKGMKYHDD